MFSKPLAADGMDLASGRPPLTRDLPPLGIGDLGANYGGAAGKFAAFTDEYLRALGLDLARVRLDRDEIDLVEVIYAWDEATI
jgi:hypothetical protein